MHMYVCVTLGTPPETLPLHGLCSVFLGYVCYWSRGSSCFRLQVQQTEAVKSSVSKYMPAVLWSGPCYFLFLNLLYVFIEEGCKCVLLAKQKLIVTFFLVKVASVCLKEL